MASLFQRLFFFACLYLFVAFTGYTGLRIDVDRVRGDNETKTGVVRKAGLIIYDGGEEIDLISKVTAAELSIGFKATIDFNAMHGIIIR